MKKITRRILNALFPPMNRYAATIVYSGLTIPVTLEAPDDFRARQELDEIADGGFIVHFARV